MTLKRKKKNIYNIYNGGKKKKRVIIFYIL